MKVEMDFFLRGCTANLYRIRAARQRTLAGERSGSATKQELEAEAAYWEEQAVKLDEAVEPASVSDKEPIRLPNDTRRDIDNVDKPAGNGVKEASNG